MHSTTTLSISFLFEICLRFLRVPDADRPFSAVFKYKSFYSFHFAAISFALSHGC